MKVTKVKFLLMLIAFTTNLFAAESADFEVKPGFKVIDSISQLREVMEQSGAKIRMKPGTYLVTEAEEDNKTVFYCTGSDNHFDFRDVTIQIDTKVLADMRGPKHSLGVYRIIGNNNTFEGGVFENVGDHPPYRSLQDFSITGNGNNFKNCTWIVRGSYPYGYGDLLGKGRNRVDFISLKKHSGVQVHGDNTRLVGCKMYHYAFGHGFFIQKGAQNAYFENCYVEGVMRSTDDMLAETSGLVYENDFRSVYPNRKGEYKITPGYMKSLSEDGFRVYTAGPVTLVNCTSKNMRDGFSFRSSGDRIENCTSIGNESGFWIGPEGVIKNCRGDAQYGPLLFVENCFHDKGNSSVEIDLLPTETKSKVHALATITGSGHNVTIRPWQGKNKNQPLPVKVGFAPPEHGEMMSPFEQYPDDWTNSGQPKNITLINETNMPVEIGSQAVNCKIITNGPVKENKGQNISIRTLKEQE